MKRGDEKKLLCDGHIQYSCGHLVLMLVLTLLSAMAHAIPPSAPRLTDIEVFAIASVAYYETQAITARQCQRATGLDSATLLRQFEDRYGEFFRTKKAEAVVVLRDKFRMTHAEFSSALGSGITPAAVRSAVCPKFHVVVAHRINDVDAVNRGINEQFSFYRSKFRQ